MITLVIKCPECGKHQLKQSKNWLNATFKCIYCRMSRKFNKKNDFGSSVWYKNLTKVPSKCWNQIVRDLNDKK